MTLPTSATPTLTDDERYTLDCYERSRGRWERICEMRRSGGGAMTMRGVDAVQIRSALWHTNHRGGYTVNALEALHLIGSLARLAGGTTISATCPDERIEGWLTYLVHLGVVMNEWGLAVGPLLELAEKWSGGEEAPLNLTAAMVDLTVMFASPVSVRVMPPDIADEMRRPAFAALGILTTAAIGEAKSFVMGRLSAPWPRGAGIIEQYTAAVELICGGSK